MKLFRSTTLSPVIISTIFTLLIAGCDSSNDATPAGSSSSAPMQSSGAAIVPKQKYADGTFFAIGRYRSPAGPEEIHLSFTLREDIVIGAEFEGMATHPKSKQMQSQFEAGFREFVIGKPIDSLHLTVVNGASLGSSGFMQAVEKIKAEAAAKT